MARYRVGATWNLMIFGEPQAQERTWELNHKPTQDELDTLAREFNGEHGYLYIPGTMRITEYTELPDEEEK